MKEVMFCVILHGVNWVFVSKPTYDRDRANRRIVTIKAYGAYFEAFALDTDTLVTPLQNAKRLKVLI